MKKLMVLGLAALSFSSISKAWIEGRENSGDPYLSPQVEECSQNLYINLSTYSSSTDKACSYGRTDRDFQTCAINTTKRFRDDSRVVFAGFLCAKGVGATNYRLQDCTMRLTDFFGPQYIDYNLITCRKVANPDFGNCVVELYKSGGLNVEDQNATADSFRLCKNQTNYQLNQCIIENHRYQGLSGPDAARICLEKFDPAVKARKEAERIAAEQHRIEEQRRLEEQRRIEEQRRLQQKRQEEAKRQEQVRLEAQRRAEEQLRQQELQAQEVKRKQDEQAKKDEEKKSSGSNGSSSSGDNSGGGVIVDLPNFE